MEYIPEYDLSRISLEPDSAQWDTSRNMSRAQNTYFLGIKSLSARWGGS